MARPSKLSDAQWEEVFRAALDGENITEIAKRYGVAKSTISERISERAKAGKELANQIVDVNRRVTQLPIIEQRSVIDLARSLMTISENMANAAISGSYTAMRLSQIAANQIDKIDEESPIDPDSQSELAIKAIAILSKTGNEASLISRELLQANKEKTQKKTGPTLEDLVVGSGE